jgi:pimeloyl-ACP methyl ester carboxylesterase
VLVVEAADESLSRWWKGRYTLADFHERLQSVPRLEKATLQEAGHMLQHDQPQALASLLENFLT